jgi:hypothetical protein
VISERKLAANRRNAAQSTGPRTRAGKLRSCRNALKHGLASTCIDYKIELPEIENLTCLILGDRPEAAALEYARDAAFAELTILATREARAEYFQSIADQSSMFTPRFLQLRWEAKRQAALERFEWQRQALLVTRRRRLARKIARACYEEAEASNKFLQPPVQLEQVAKDILNLDRYERQAIARRNRALRQLDAIRQTEHE